MCPREPAECATEENTPATSRRGPIAGIYDAFDGRAMDQQRLAQDPQRDLMLLAVLREIADLRALIAEFVGLVRRDAADQAPLHWDRN